LTLFRSLVRLRKETPALAVGAYRTLPAPEDVFSFERYHPDGTVQVHLNFGATPREIDLPFAGKTLLSTCGEPSLEASRLTLRGYEGVVHK
jgi:hypothetical protein